jgi:transposase
MDEYIAFDSHKHYTLAEREEVETGRTKQTRIEHRRGALRGYLDDAAPGTPVAVEATGNWYWIVEEIEQAGCVPRLVHPRKAKMMMGMINKTDKLDVHGLNRLQRTGTLPTVWIPPGRLRDLRELTRGRMVLVAMRTRVKNRLTATLAKYGLRVEGVSDAYGRRGREQWPRLLALLPPETRWGAEQFWELLDCLEERIAAYEDRIEDLVQETPGMRLLRSLPGVGFILAATIALEVGRIERFPTDEHLASYAGTTPRVHASGGKVRYGPLRPDVNRTLKWAFAEAANSVAVNHIRCPERSVSRLYRRLRRRKGHAKAIGAVARRLAEATWHVWSREEPYRDRIQGRGKRDTVMSPSRLAE